MIPENLEERNKWFKSLSRTDKRIQVAKDVIAQIELQKYKANRGAYFTIDTNLQNNSCLQTVVDNHTCNVCAIGALFASKVRLGNEATLDQFKTAGSTMSDETLNVSIFNPEIAIEELFDIDELRLIEVAFEGYDAVSYFMDEHGEYDEYDDEDVIVHAGYHKAVEFHEERERHLSNSEILIEIMENIIENEGVFVL